MMQTALQKERREIKQIQREADNEGTVVGLQKSWSDPMPSGIYYLVTYLEVQQLFTFNRRRILLKY